MTFDAETIKKDFLDFCVRHGIKAPLRFDGPFGTSGDFPYLSVSWKEKQCKTFHAYPVRATRVTNPLPVVGQGVLLLEPDRHETFIHSNNVQIGRPGYDKDAKVYPWNRNNVSKTQIAIRNNYRLAEALKAYLGML